MIESNLAYDYVGNIPWDKNPAFAFSDDSEAYIQAFRNVVDKLPVKDLKISFNDDVWNFNPYFKGINDDSYKVIFTNLPDQLKDFSKFFVLYNIMSKKKIPTTNLRYSDAKSILLNIMNFTFHKTIYVITTDDIKNEILRRNVSPITNHNLYESVYQYYYFLINNYKLELPVEIKIIKNLGIEEKNKAKEKEEDNKLTNIPEEYYTAILKAALTKMRDKKAEYNSRVTACLIVMLTQLGLRISDLVGLTIDQLHYKKLSKSGSIAYYIRYKSRKPSKPRQPMLEFDIFSNDLCTEAFQTIKKIRKNCTFSKDYNYLYVLNSTHNSKDEFPVPRHRFNREYKSFLLETLPDYSTREWEGITATTIYNKDAVGKKDDKRISIYPPDTRQYRVHLCTALYEAGVPLAYIQKYMGHLSDYMQGYYVRPKDTYQENIEYSERVIREIAGNDITPLGGTIGEDIKKNIQKFINENKFNVKTDIKEIMEILGDKVIIRGKTGGVCIKTTLMPCSKDARTNEIMCAYNLCPNLFHFFYMIDVSYLNFKTLQETYSTNLSTGKSRAAQKELTRIKDLCRRRLIPELDELEKEINRKGKESIIEQYPTLLDTIENKDKIMEEISLWMKKN